MKTLKIISAVVLVSAFGVAVAAQDPLTESATTRQQRMDEALDHYRGNQASGDARNPHPGPAARTEESVKRGARKTGNVIERGAKAVGHAIGTGLNKTGDALHSGGDKLQGKPAP